MSDYARAIRICRAARGLTQGELAARLSVGKSQLSLLESGGRQPSLKTLAEIAEALRVPLPLLILLGCGPEQLRVERRRTIDSMARDLLEVLVSPLVGDAEIVGGDPCP